MLLKAAAVWTFVAHSFLCPLVIGLGPQSGLSRSERSDLVGVLPSSSSDRMHLQCGQQQVVDFSHLLPRRWLGADAAVRSRLSSSLGGLLTLTREKGNEARWEPGISEMMCRCTCVLSHPGCGGRVGGQQTAWDCWTLFERRKLSLLPSQLLAMVCLPLLLCAFLHGS